MDVLLDILAIIVVDFLLFLMIVGSGESTLWEPYRRPAQPDRAVSPGIRRRVKIDRR